MTALEEATIRIQRAVSATPDGVWGMETAAKVLALMQGKAPELVEAKEEVGVKNYEVDPRSAKNIATLLPPVQEKAVALLKACAEQGMNFRVTSGYRTYDEQKILYEAHLRGGPSAAPPGHSNHNFAIAFDLTEFNQAGQPVWESPNYARAGALGKALGLTWGGNFANGDEPHFELHPRWAAELSENQMLAVLRQRHDDGKAIFA